LRSEGRTLQVEFTLTRTDAVFRKKQPYTGRLVMLRDTDRSVYGILQLTSDADPQEKETYVLRGDDVYEYYARDRVVTPFRFAAGPLIFLANRWMGALWLLDRGEGLKRCDVRVLKRDKHYTYFTVKVEQTPLLFFGGGPVTERREYQLAVVRTGTDELPAGSIRQLASVGPNGEGVDYTVTRWVVNGPDKIKPADFPDPANLPKGWELKSVPFVPPAKLPPRPGSPEK
jgi:hypothetical protein